MPVKLGPSRGEGELTGLPENKPRFGQLKGAMVVLALTSLPEVDAGSGGGGGSLP